MPTEIDTERRILVPDDRLQDLFLETVRTLPVFICIENAEFRFAADGLESSSFPTNERDSYTALCKEKRIKPFSRGKVTCNSEGVFVVYGIFRYDSILEDDIEGGRTNVYEVNLRSHVEFVKFGESLDLLASKGYKMMMGDLWFGSIRGSCPEGGRYKNGGIDIGTYSFNKGVKLVLSDIFGEVDREFAEDWFKRLKTKYQPPSE